MDYKPACQGCNSPEHGKVPHHPADVTFDFFLVGLMLFAAFIGLAVIMWVVL